MLAVHPIREVLVVWVNVIQNSISVGLVARSEHDHLHLLASFLQEFYQVWPEVDSSADYFVIFREVDLKNYIRLLSFYVVNTVN